MDETNQSGPELKSKESVGQPSGAQRSVATATDIKTEATESGSGSKVKTRTGSGYLKQLYSTARVTAGNTHTHLKSLTTFLVNFVPTDHVDPSELQVRTHFNDEEIAALAHSIKEHGVLQPILVVQDGDRYKVIAGERRLRASKLAGIERIPARVLNTNDKSTHEIALRENLDRVDLHPLEEGEGYVSLLEAKAYTSYESIAKAFGKPKSRITECIQFTRLPDETKQELLKTGLKNRSLLRTLPSFPKERQIAIIREASQKEEEIRLDAAGGSGSESTVDSSVAGATGSAVKQSEKQNKPLKSFNYICNEKGLKMPSYSWKEKDGKAALKHTIDQLLEMIDQVEKKFLN